MLDDLTQPLLESAWERVHENAGGPGVDGVTVDRFESQSAAALPEMLGQLKTASYLPLPLRKIVVEKKPGTGIGRQLLVPSVRDRVLQTAFARMLSRSFEEEFLEMSYAYRPGRGVDRAVARILQLRDHGWTHVVDADITSYFDEISHNLMEERLIQETAIDPAALHVLNQWIKAEVWDGHELTKLRRGVPQGSPLSPLLANFFLTPLDVALAESDCKMIRYSDDFVILCKSPESARTALALTETILKQLALKLNFKKTRLTSFEEGFKFLGVKFSAAEASIPWKPHKHDGRLLFLAPLMPQALLRKYRKAHQPQPLQKPARKAAAFPPAHTQLKTGDDMPFLYITQQGAILRKSGDRFLLEQDGEIAMDLPYYRLQHILIFGNVQLTSQAMAEALDHNIAVSLFTRQGRFRGTLAPPPGKNVLLRLQQYGMRQNATQSLDTARQTIRAKLENSLTVLERYEDRDRDTNPTLQLRHSIRDIHAGLMEASTLPELQGREGSAARLYFEGLMKFNRSTLVWPGRQKHPSKDPLNALLSLTYTLLMQELSALGEAFGLDPAIGFLHEVDGARPSLALDLMEPFRAPVADRFVLTIANRGQVREDDFERRDDHGGLFLKPDAMRKFFDAYERWMLTTVEREPREKSEPKQWHFRDLLRREVANFQAMLKSGDKWVPYNFAPNQETPEGT